ncbi:hypothetical protein [Neobacillus sp. DY30]|uniref:hypothetical protein n=1 Tax=Neobacillus sp. DY30 TaxID=3047871 RepID=UPI0024C07EEA|nr:hypothetical protein [Neobacillus sp. DY30]WHY01343.1 hypothetical protein QNH29_03570 [Neobacillus sp. DY30]
MSRIVIMEVAMKEELPDLYDIYFGGKVLLQYEEEIPCIVVGTTSKMGKDTAIELLRGCEQFKAYHKYLFGIEVKSFVTDDKQFKKVNNWLRHFHPNGIYR